MHGYFKADFISSFTKSQRNKGNKLHPHMGVTVMCCYWGEGE